MSSFVASRTGLSPISSTNTRNRLVSCEVVFCVHFPLGLEKAAREDLLRYALCSHNHTPSILAHSLIESGALQPGSRPTCHPISRRLGSNAMLMLRVVMRRFATNSATCA
jgi:hypothetical protein